MEGNGTALKKVRIGTDVIMSLRVKDSGVVMDWTDVTIKGLQMYSDAQMCIAGKVEYEIDGEDPSELHLKFPGSRQCYMGDYRVVSILNYEGMDYSFDVPAFTLVARSDIVGTDSGTAALSSDNVIGLSVELESISTSLLQGIIDECLKATEDAREATEDIGNLPTIGDNGNWMLWSVESKAYVDSGKSSQGAPGHTPEKGVDYFTPDDIESLNIPTRVSQLENDKNYVTESQLTESQNRKQDKLESGRTIKTINGESILGSGNITIDLSLYKVVESLPETDIDPNKIYLVLDTSGNDGNKYTEYVYVIDTWEELGTYTATVDLTPYLKKKDAEQLYLSKSFASVTYATKTELGGKVDKEEGKGLSSNDYTNEDKQKVEAQDGYVRAIAELRAAIRGLSSVVDNAGHLKVEMLDMADLPLVCGEKMHITGAGAPSVPPTVPFQEYYDGSNNKFYRAKGVLPDTPTVSDWIALN